MSVLVERRRISSYAPKPGKGYRYRKTHILLDRDEALEVTDRRNFSLFLPFEYEDAARKPYCILPRKEGGCYLVVPRWIPLHVGWLEKQTPFYNVFVVDHYTAWISGGIPEELKAELGFPEPRKLRLLDGYLYAEDLETREWAWERYRRYLSKREGLREIRVKPRARFSLILELLRDGVLPFSPRPVGRRQAAVEREV